MSRPIEHAAMEQLIDCQSPVYGAAPERQQSDLLKDKEMIAL
jgi:hypothetical protein